MEKDKTVIISDLHIDTWNEKKIDGKTKTEHFFDFLNWIEPFAARLIINGDLVDAPPHNNKYLLPTYYKVLARLTDFAKTTEIYYFVGNHDISFWGVKVKGFNNINITYPYYPHLYIDFKSGNDRSYMYFEHGHFYDPVLNLYIYQTIKSLRPKAGMLKKLKRIYYRIFAPPKAEKEMLKEGLDAGTLNHAVIRAAQRRNPATGKKTQPLGTHNWGDYWSELETFLWKKFTPLVNKYYKPFTWKDAAEDLFANFCIEHPDKNVRAVIMGHTHLPDESEIKFRDKKAVYLNSGDWAEPVFEKDPDTHHASFIIFDKEGNLERDNQGTAVRDFIIENGPMEIYFSIFNAKYT